MSTTDTIFTPEQDDILALAAQRAAGVRLGGAEERRLDRAMLDDPDLALLILDAGDVAAPFAASDPAVAPPLSTGAHLRLGVMPHLRLGILAMGMMACFGIGATAGAQLAQGLVGPSSKTNPHVIEVRPIGDGLSLSFDAARKRK